MNAQLEQLMQKEMTRKEFIATLGLGVASIMGMSTIIQMLTGKSLSMNGIKHSGSSLGYGSSAYGGAKD